MGTWAGLWGLALLQHFWAGRGSRGLECGSGAWGRMGRAMNRSGQGQSGGLQMLRVQYCDLLLQVSLLLIVNLHQMTVGGENEALNQ